jgi:hypothetical protein
MPGEMDCSFFEGKNNYLVERELQFIPRVTQQS